MGIKCGIVGLPNVGKSTFFNAMCENAKAEAANYPFCTIEPNKTFVEVPDDRLNKIAKIAKSAKIVPTFIELIDIAGLVKGASQGEGCGNKFLSHIMEVDMIIHVVRCFKDDNIAHVHGAIDPISDIKTIETELILYDLAKLEKKYESLLKKVKSGSKEAVQEIELVKSLLSHVEEGNLVSSYAKVTEHKEAIKQLFLLTAKPMIYVCNVEEKSINSGNENSMLIVDHAKQSKSDVIIICAKFEDEIKVFDNLEDRKESLKQVGINSSGIENVIHSAYKTLGLRSYFTAGEKESRMWSIQAGINAKLAASIIHSDISNGFVKAEVISCEDYLKYGENARDHGKMKIEGKDYIVRDGDVIHFLFNKTK